MGLVFEDGGRGVVGRRWGGMSSLDFSRCFVGGVVWATSLSLGGLGMSKILISCPDH